MTWEAPHPFGSTVAIRNNSPAQRRTHPNSANEFIIARERQPPDHLHEGGSHGAFPGTRSRRIRVTSLARAPQASSPARPTIPGLTATQFDCSST